MKELLKQLLRRTPYRVMRAVDLNRFQAIEECLEAARIRGYAPRIIIDGGANVGEFARLARRHFPDAVIHLIEPQPACIATLERLSAGPRYVLHPHALGAVEGKALLSIEPDAVTTGAFIVRPGLQSSHQAEVRVCPLDDMEIGLTSAHRALLKLDLQGYELEALKGATRSLDAVELVLCEVSFFAEEGAPLCGDIVAFLSERGFDLYDIASISARGRDNRARQADFLFARRGSPLTLDAAWA